MAIAVGSIVVDANASNGNAEIPAPYGYVTGTPGAGTWDVFWSNGGQSQAVPTAQLAEITAPYKVNDLLRRRVRPNRSVDPSMVGVVVIQSAADQLLVEAPAMNYMILKTAAVEV